MRRLGHLTHPLRGAAIIAALTTTLAACADEELGGSTPATAAVTYYADAKAIIDARCATCHRAGDIAPFPLTTFDEVSALAEPVRASIEAGTMPPWQPSDECNSYLDSIDLTADEKQTLLAWLDDGAPAGDPADAPPASGPPEPTLEVDLFLQLPEPYAPTQGPDDHRCQLIPWPAEDVRYVTGARVTPEQRAIVHHVILYVVGPEQVEQFQAYDEAEDGPGYTCFGGPQGASEGRLLGSADPAQLLEALQRMGLTPADLQAGNITEDQLAQLIDELGSNAGGFTSIGSWVPGAPAPPMPAGTGIRVEPGSMIVAQFHYNTSASPSVPDQSTIEIATVDAVEREAAAVPLVDLGWISNGLVGEPMTIPAGEAQVEHETTIAFDSMLVARARRTLGLPDDAPLLIHRAGHHMHQLGTRQRSELHHADGDRSCLLDIPDWDFAWQGSYTLAEPILFEPGDSLWMGCTWDNSMANQPVVGGELRAPVDVAWGDGTADEMCLGSLLVTAP